MRKLIVLPFILVITQIAIGQTCTCASDYQWLKETFEKNDAGFQLVIDQKGIDAYQKHCDDYAQKVKLINDRQECLQTLYAWLTFFRNGHLGIIPKFDNNPTVEGEADQQQIKEKFKDWETLPYKEKEFNNYLSKLEKPSFEGIWTSPPYTIGIRKVDTEYVGFIIEADGIYWSPSQVKFKIKFQDKKWIASYYMQDHSETTLSSVELIGNNFLQMDFVTLQRLKPDFPKDHQAEMSIKFLTTDVPLFEKISENTAVIRIPSFDHGAKNAIDSLIEANWKVLTSAENLIIDLRYNGGGSDRSFEKLLPLIYTNPIRTVGVEFLSTPLNNQRMVEFMNDPNWSEADKKWAKEGLDILNQHIGEFVNLDSTNVTIETFDTIYVYPKNVGILVNEGNGSTTEQFLLAAKQSKKVKLFGTTTAGVLDISNMHFVDAPCNNFSLGYSLSRSMRIPEMTIDNKGIQPDYYLDHTISNHEWIEFVQHTLK